MSERRGGAKVMWLALVAVFVLLLVLQDAPPRPYDLASASPDGYKGLALLLRETGTTVRTVDAADVDASAVQRFPVVFVPVPEGAPSGTVARWRDYAAAGGRLVLGLGSRELGAPAAQADEQVPTFDLGTDAYLERRPGRCDIPSLAVDGLRPMRWFPENVELRVRGRAGCYGNDRRALLASTPTGAGEVVNLASPDLFTNELLGAPDVGETQVRNLPDNALVARTLLGGAVPSAPGGGTLAVVTSGVSVAPEGQKDLADFLPLGVKIGIVQIVVAVLVYAVARGRRHGRVVEEPVPVSLAGSSFTEAVGDLLERQGDHERAATVLRRARRRELAERLGLPLDIEAAQLAAVLASRTGREADEVLQILTGPVVDDDGLVELCRSLDSLRQEAVHV